MKHSQELINEAHDLAFRGELSNKAIAKKLKLTANQLHYILYVKQDSAMIEDLKAIDKHGYFISKKPTITESFLDFFISEDFR